MTTSPDNRTTARRRGLLRRTDQVSVALLVLAGLGMTAGWWLWQGGHRGRMIELDQSEPRMASFQVDINDADWPEIAQMPGIGETLARRIAESRRREGPFVDHDDLRRVRGIGPKTLERIRVYLLPLADHRAVAGR